MTVRSKNFSGQTTPTIVDIEYVECNFSQPNSIDVGGLRRGVRLFPGDDTPRVFTRCNLVNCEPPPGSTMVGCNTWILEMGVVTSTDTITVDGVTETIEHHSNFVHSRYVDGAYVDQVPFESVVD